MMVVNIACAPSTAIYPPASIYCSLLFYRALAAMHRIGLGLYVSRCAQDTSSLEYGTVASSSHMLAASLVTHDDSLVCREYAAVRVWVDCSPAGWPGMYVMDVCKE